jgi:hypothetical protein
MKRRKPQPRCKCGHAKSQHGKYYAAALGIDYFSCCGYCLDRCFKFEQDNLATLERLNEFKEQKEIEAKEDIKQVSL